MTDIRPIWERSHPVAIAEVERLRADLATYGKDTAATENRIIDAEFKAQELLVSNERLRAALEEARRDLNGLCPRSDTGSKRKTIIENAVKRIETALNHEQKGNNDGLV